ncbi:hypothetical protein K438DRAFT_1761426 [Mycena galopus ATCC 62051]|nr:hypothetical protein K438DRAFT_1761426 [Mycena galopus ATCC 62051]
MSAFPCSSRHGWLDNTKLSCIFDLNKKTGDLLPSVGFLNSEMPGVTIEPRVRRGNTEPVRICVQIEGSVIVTSVSSEVLVQIKGQGTGFQAFPTTKTKVFVNSCSGSKSSHNFEAVREFNFFDIAPIQSICQLAHQLSLRPLAAAHTARWGAPLATQLSHYNDPNEPPWLQNNLVNLGVRKGEIACSPSPGERDLMVGDAY